MNSTIKTLIVGTLLFTVVGCGSVSQNLPSVTIGGGVNNDGKLLDLRCNKEGLGLTVPLMALEIPTPKLTSNKEE